ncbi:MAG: hypothetical protein V4539_11410 [Bacteroidota bacterium]
MSVKFIAGLLIGAAVVHFLNTPEGKDLLCRFKKDADKMKDDLENLADDLVDKGRAFMSVMEEEVDRATS